METIRRLTDFIAGNKTPDSSFYLTAVTALGLIGQALHDSGQPQLALIGGILIGAYTIAHKIQVASQANAEAKKAQAVAASATPAPAPQAPVKVEVPVTVSLDAGKGQAEVQAPATEPTLEHLSDATVVSGPA
ncbi:MAG: hypothetical protein EOP64_00025 [Sphingomonas sp.]|nr:MAG: hypothetical protein EOP64_00025 [Sphingomonas sp.]